MKIQWTDETDNIIVPKIGGWWCRMISEGCANCYAAALNQSDYFGGNHLPYTGKAPEMVLRTELLKSWAKQRKAKKHFVASMTDIFGDWVPRVMVFEFLDAMYDAPKQTFQMLTKRPEIALEHICDWLSKNGLKFLPSNMWVGTSVENQKCADERIPALLKIPAKVRFLSCEPLLGPVKLPECPKCLDLGGCGQYCDPAERGISWVIVGGESGKGARPCKVEWIRSVLEQCKAAGVSCFVKQLGGNLSDCDLSECARASGKSMHDPKGGDPSEWPEDLRVRQFPQ